MAARDDAETSVASFESVRIIEDLDVIAVTLGEINRVLVFPVVVILMETDTV